MANDSREPGAAPVGPTEAVPSGERSPWSPPGPVPGAAGPGHPTTENQTWFGGAAPASHSWWPTDGGGASGHHPSRDGIPPAVPQWGAAPSGQVPGIGAHPPPPHEAWWPAQQPYDPRSGGPPPTMPTVGLPPGSPPSGRGRLVALGVAGVLLAGVVGGLVGHTVAEGGGTGSRGVLDEPLPAINSVTAPPSPIEAVAARVLPSVVQLRVEGVGASGEGSAMVLSADGLLLTNNHVVEAAAAGGQVTAVFQDGRTAAARIVGRDPSSDLAVLRAQAVSGLAPVELGNSESVRVGQQVIAFGSPLGLGGTVTTGIISAIDRAVNVGEESGANTPTVLNALQTDAAINPGNSGGPLVDMDGRVVGINSAIATTGAQGGSIGVGFSIPINQARRVADELERTGRATRAVLGVSVADDPRRPGAIIRTVTPGSAAEAAGIRQNDIVVRFGDQRISNGTDLQAAVGSRAPGEVVEIQLADRTVRATLAAAPN